MNYFLTRIFEIAKRAYYLIAFSVTIGSVLSLSYFYLFTDRTDRDWEVIGFICFFFLPIAIIFHRVAHWIIWGKLK